MTKLHETEWIPGTDNRRMAVPNGWIYILRTHTDEAGYGNHQHVRIPVPDPTATHVVDASASELAALRSEIAKLNAKLAKLDSFTRDWLDEDEP